MSGAPRGPLRPPRVRISFSSRDDLGGGRAGTADPGERETAAPAGTREPGHEAASPAAPGPAAAGDEPAAPPGPEAASELAEPPEPAAPPAAEVEHGPPAAGPAPEAPPAAEAPPPAATAPPAAAAPDGGVKAAPGPAKQGPPPHGGGGEALQQALPAGAVGTVAVPYVVRPGDTLAAIARAFGIPLARLREANPEVADARVFPGQVLSIPLRPPMLPTVRRAFTLHVLQPGQTLEAVAAQYRVSPEALEAANPLLPRARARPGAFVAVPAVPQPGPAALPALLYAVQPGDTLAGIAAAFGVRLADLRAANPGVAGERVFPGEVLAVPVAGVPTEPVFRERRYVVQPGDAAASIAAQFQVPLLDLEELNVVLGPVPGLVIAVPRPVLAPALPEAPPGFPPCRPAPFGQALALRDDDWAFVPFRDGFAFPFFGQPVRDGVFVSSNGQLTFGEGDPSFVPTTDAFVEGPPRIAALWADLLPESPQATPGGVFVAQEEVAGARRLVVTWDRVPYFFDRRRFQTFQISLHQDGTIAFCYADVSPPGLEGVRALVGVGGGRAQPRGNVFLFDGQANPRRLGPDEPTPAGGLSGRILVYRFDPAIGNYRLRST